MLNGVKCFLNDTNTCVKVKEKQEKPSGYMGGVRHMYIHTLVVNMKVKKALCGIIIVPTLAYANEAWTWNEVQRSKTQAYELSNRWLWSKQDGR